MYIDPVPFSVATIFVLIGKKRIFRQKCYDNIDTIEVCLLHLLLI